jgi:serine/threonine-protein kinase
MADALSPGMVVADTYEVDRLLGRGGMGEVWLGRHQRLQGKQVAIKVLHTQGALPAEALARFKREAEIAVRLEHPNIVQVLDFNSLPSGQPFIVMELLKGESLGARLKRGALSPDETAQVMRQVCSALHVAHAATVVHRDLKPENIYLVPTALGDQVKVLDFGISKLSDGGTMQTTDSVLMGTPLYMSPEQALGHNRDVTQQSDVFSLGSIAYECLAGKAPFQADNIAQVVFRIAYEPHKPLTSVAPNVPAGMAQAVEHALQKDLAQRTPSVAAFVLELTGQVLSNAGSPKVAAANVLKPGEQVDEAMMAEATAAPSSKVQAKLLMTPNPPVASEPALPTPRSPPARRSPLLLIGGAVGVLAIGVGAYLASSTGGATATGSLDASVTAVAPPTVDAGSAVVEPPTPAVDAGPLPAVTPLADAGTPDAKPVDAGAAASPKTPLQPPSPEDALLISEFEAETKTNSDAAWARRSSMQLKIQSPGGKRVLLTTLVEMSCQRADLTNAQAYSRQLSGSAKELARKRCRKFQPGWELD